MNSRSHPYFIKISLAVLGLLFLSSLLLAGYFAYNEESRDRANFVILDRFNMSLDKVFHPLWLSQIQDPDKDRDGLEDFVAEPYVYLTDPEAFDSQSAGMSDGESTYNIYRAAIETGVEKKLLEFRERFQRYDDHVVSLADQFEWRGIQTYNSYVGVSEEVNGPLRQAQDYRAEGKTEESVELLEKTLQEHPGNPLVRYSIARSYHNQEEYQKALDIYLDIIDDPKARGPFLFSDIAAAYYGLEDKDKYVEYYQKSVEEFPQELNQYLYLASFLEGENRLKEAEAVLYKGLEIEPRYAGFYNLLAIIANKRNDSAEEIRLYKEAIKHDFAFAAGHFNLSLIYSREFNNTIPGYEPSQDDLEEAIVEARIAAELDPNTRHVGHLILLYSKYGREDKVQALEEELLTRDDVGAGVLNDLGLMYFDRKEYNKAESYYLQALEIAPTMKNPYNNLGNVYTKKGDFDKALEYYLKAIEIDPLYYGPHSNIGALYYNRWNAEKNKEDLLEARKWDEKAVELRPTEFSAHQSLGRTYLKLAGRDEELLRLAEKHLKIATKLQPQDSLSQAELGFVYYNLNEFAKAKQAWEAGKALGYESNLLDEYLEKVSAY